MLEQPIIQLDKFTHLLQSYSFKRTLERGFSLIRDAQGKVISSLQATKPCQAVTVTLSDGDCPAQLNPSPGSKPRRTRTKSLHHNKTPDLFSGETS